jgi:hypothetical protein
VIATGADPAGAPATGALATGAFVNMGDLVAG